MADYINPTSIRPENGWKPQGFLGGMEHAMDRQRYEDTATLQDYMMGNSAIESGAKLSDYFSDAPVREAERGSKIATANATTATIGDQKKGELRKLNLDNDLASGTLQANIAKRVAEAALEGGKQSMQQMEMASMVAAQLAQAANSGPAALNYVMQQLTKAGAPPQMMQFFAQIRDPNQLKAVAQAMQNGLRDANIQYQREWSLHNLDNDSRETIARGNNDATRFAATQGAGNQTDARRKAAVFRAIAEGKEEPGIYEEGTRYLAQEIENSPRMKALSQMLMMDAMSPQEGGTGGRERGKINEEMRQHAYRMWDQQAPGKLKQRNPFAKEKPKQDPNKPRLPDGVRPG